MQSVDPLGSWEGGERKSSASSGKKGEGKRKVRAAWFVKFMGERGRASCLQAGERAFHGRFREKERILCGGKEKKGGKEA